MSFAVVSISHNRRHAAVSQPSAREAVDKAMALFQGDPDLAMVYVIGRDGETWPMDLVISPEAVAARQKLPSAVLANHFRSNAQNSTVKGFN